jgi:hypothetical protein
LSLDLLRLLLGLVHLIFVFLNLPDHVLLHRVNLLSSLSFELVPLFDNL